MTDQTSKERNPLAVNLEILGSLIRFAYANGYHELGYDVLAEAVAQLRGEVETKAEPDEPTPEMIQQGIWAWQRNERASTAEDVRAIYMAMRHRWRTQSSVKSADDEPQGSL